MAAPTLEHNSSFKFQHSSPLDNLVRRTSSRRAQGPPKTLAPSRHDPLPLYTSHGANLPSPPRQQQRPPPSPLLHTQFRGSTFSAATNDRNSFLDTSMASNIGGDISLEAEYVYRDDDASVYSTPSMLPPPRPQDRSGPSDPQMDHNQSSESGDDAYTGTTAHSDYSLHQTQRQDNMDGMLAFQAHAELLLPTVVISPAVDPDPPTPALKPTRGGKEPIAAPPKFNFSRPGRPPQLPPEDLKRQVMERNVGRHPAHPPPPPSIPVGPNAVAPGLPRNVIAGSVPPVNTTMDPPPHRPAQPLIPRSPTSPPAIGPPANMNLYDSPQSTFSVSRSWGFPQSPGAIGIPEIHGPDLPQNLQPDGLSLVPVLSQPTPSPQPYSRPRGPISLDDPPSGGTSRIMAPSRSSLLPEPDATSPLHQQSLSDMHYSGLPESVDVSSFQSSSIPDSSTHPNPIFGSDLGPFLNGSPGGLPRNMSFFDEPSSSEPSSSGQPQCSHWSVDGASILGPPPGIVDRDTASPSLSGSTTSGRKRNKLRKARRDGNRDGNGYESDGYVSDGGKKRKGKVKGKEIVVLWPEAQQDSYSQGAGPVDDRRSEGLVNHARLPTSVIPDASLPSPEDFSRAAGPGLNDDGRRMSRSLNAQNPPLFGLSVGTILLHDSPGADTSRTTNLYDTSPSHTLPSPSPTPQGPPHSISLDGFLGGGLPRSINLYSEPPPNVTAFQRSPASISLNDPSSTGSPRSMHSYGPHPILAQGSPPTSPSFNFSIGPHQRPSGPISLSDPPSAPSRSMEPYQPSPTFIQGLPPLSSSPGVPPKAQYSEPPSRSPNPGVIESPLPDYSDYSLIRPEAPSRPSTDTVTGRRPTIELPRAPPPRATSPAASVYSQYSFYQLDSNNASPTSSTANSFPDSHAFTLWPAEGPRPPHLSPHYTPPARFPGAGSRSSSLSSTISPTHTLSPHSPQEYLQLGIQHHEANRLKDAAICFEKSAKDDGGCGVGMVMWGLTLRHGWGCEKNENLGFKWLQRAAQSAVADLESSRKGLDTNAVQDELVIAIYEVGQCFFQGWGVRKDLKMAVSYYTVAARLGDADAQQDLGFCLANGRGCKKDRKEAAKWYREAVAQGASDVGMAWIYKEKFQ